jgi:hypothetical protein
MINLTGALIVCYVGYFLMAAILKVDNESFFDDAGGDKNGGAE